MVAGSSSSSTSCELSRISVSCTTNWSAEHHIFHWIAQGIGSIWSSSHKSTKIANWRGAPYTLSFEFKWTSWSSKYPTTCTQPALPSSSLSSLWSPWLLGHSSTIAATGLPKPYHKLFISPHRRKLNETTLYEENCMWHQSVHSSGIPISVLTCASGEITGFCCLRCQVQGGELGHCRSHTFTRCTAAFSNSAAERVPSQARIIFPGTHITK